MYEAIYDLPITDGGELPFQLPQWIATAPFEQFLGMQIEEAKGGRALLTMPFKGALCQGKGYMHGGAVVSLADTALAMAIKSILPEGTDFVTTELALEFHAPIRFGTVRAEARVTSREERTIKGVVEVITAEGIKAATFRGCFKIRKGSAVAASLSC